MPNTNSNQKNEVKSQENESKAFENFRKSYYSILHRSDFLSENFILSLSKKSKELFDLGKPGQGYVGLVDLKTGKVYFVPSFNQNDGLLHQDIHGQPFSVFVTTGPLGKLGYAHSKACQLIEPLKREHNKSGEQGKVLGFGIWKEGYGIKFIYEMPERSGLIPNEYLVIKSALAYQIFYVDENRYTYKLENHLTNMELLQDDRLQPLFTEKERAEIESFVHVYHRSNQKSPSKECSKIKLAKNRSTSQNAYAIQYTEEYRTWFLRVVLDHSSHVDDLRRELPLKVFQKIMDCVFRSLDAPPVNLMQSSLIPKGSDGIYEHFLLEKAWRENPNQVLLEYGFLAPNKDAMKKALQNGALLSKSVKVIIRCALDKQDKRIMEWLKEEVDKVKDPKFDDGYSKIIMELIECIHAQRRSLSRNSDFLDFCLYSCELLSRNEDIVHLIRNFMDLKDLPFVFMNLLALKAELNHNDLLWMSVLYRDTNLALECLKAGADPNFYKEGRSVVGFAVSSIVRVPEILEWIFINSPLTLRKPPPLLPETLASAIGLLLSERNPPKPEDLDCLKLLLKNNPEQLYVYLRKDDSASAEFLHQALHSHWPDEAIELLCQHGANPNQKNYFQQSAYDIALSSGRGSVADILKKYMPLQTDPNVGKGLRTLGTFAACDNLNKAMNKANGDKKRCIMIGILALLIRNGIAQKKHLDPSYLKALARMICYTSKIYSYHKEKDSHVTIPRSA